MGHRGFNRQWSRHAEELFEHRGRPRGDWGWEPGGRHGHPGPPPWVAGLFGLTQGDRQRGPRVRRGDVRSAILDVVRAAQDEGEQVNGYQVIQQIAERSNGAWRPSPGSVYPTIQQLEDEGLLETDDSRSRRSLRLTEEGRAYATEHADELAAVWAPFDRPEQDEESGGLPDLKREIGQMMGAVWQVATSGTDEQRRAAFDILVDTRRKLYGVLADGDTGEE